MGGLGKQHDVVNQAVGKGHAVLEPQGDAGVVGCPGQQGVDQIQCRRKEHEGKLDGFGDAGQPGSKGGRQHDVADPCPVIRSGRVLAHL